MVRRALFVDRDGVLNEGLTRQVNGKPVLSGPRAWDEVRLNDALFGLSSVKHLGFRLILVTNQPDVERGLLSSAFVEEYHRSLVDKFELDAVYFSPFASNHHPLKKPNPGMFLKAAEDFDLCLAESFHLGDTENDTKAATNAGCHSILWDRPYNRSVLSDFRVSDLDSLLGLLSAPRMQSTIKESYFNR